MAPATGYAGEAAPVQRPSELGAIAARVRVLIGQANGNATRLRRLADGVMGAEPANIRDSDNGKVSGEPPALTAIGQALEQLAVELESTARQVERLERL